MLDPDVLPLPVDIPPVSLTFYVVFESGALGRITASEGLEPVLADGAKLVTQEVWEGLQAQMREQHEARLADLEVEEEESRRQQYQDLRAAGIPETSARGLSRYTGPDLTPNPQAGDHS
ncbi:hypothetical protein ABZ379_33715 [Streptomyces canus]|uniref:hypothetical protein n=1 Tax=Streptomyces canus TaxID=58343 RepID=UPI00340EB355